MFAHGDGGPEPEWVKTEREQFSDFRDLNKDGKMDADEIRHWIMPQDYDHAQAEARHLVYESDKDKVPWFTCVTSGPAVVHQVSDLTTFCFQDQMLTKEEILDNWNMFVGSQATNYGEDLTRNHDELWALCVCVPEHRRACVWEREKGHLWGLRAALVLPSHCWDRCQWNQHQRQEENSEVCPLNDIKASTLV